VFRISDNYFILYLIITLSYILRPKKSINFEELYGVINMSLSLKLNLFIYSFVLRILESQASSLPILLTVLKVNTGTGTPYSYMIEVYIEISFCELRANFVFSCTVFFECVGHSSANVAHL
jgi:hypothetical protein